MGRFFVKVLLSVIFFLLACSSFAEAFPEFEFFPQGGYSLQPASDKIRLGRTHIQPGLAFETSYTDNVFLTADKTFANGSAEGRNEDLILSIKPSLFLEQKRAVGELFGFHLFYEGEGQHYIDLRATQNTFNHHVGGALNFGSAGGKSDFTAGGSYHKTNSFIGQDFRSNFGSRVGVETYVSFAKLVYSFSKIIKMQLKTELTQNRFDQSFSKVQDVDIYSLDASIFRQTNPIFAYGLKYVHRVRSYKSTTLENDNSVSNQVFFSVRWEPNPLIKSEISVGYEIKKFKRFAEEDLDKPIFQVALTYQPTTRTLLTLTGTREIADSIFQTIQTYIYNYVNLNLNQKMGKKFTLEAMGQLEYLDYRRPAQDFAGLNPSKLRLDMIVKGSAALIYDIKDWLQVKAQYIYEENISNFNDNDFVSNTGLLAISAKY
jgi:Putative beta-barrel porin 2